MGQIEDPLTGNRARVTSRGKLESDTVFHSITEMRTVDDGLTWTFPFDAIDPDGADDYFVYIRNDDDNDLLAITRINAFTTVAGTLEIQRVTGTPSGGTDVTLVPRNLGSTKLPGGTFQTGTNITGLTDNGVLEFWELEAIITPPSRPLDNDPIIIPPNFAVAFLWTESTGILTGNITLSIRAVG